MTTGVPAETPDPKITLEVSREHGALQLSINKTDENGGGFGYRIAGPKFSGGSEVLLVARLDARDAAELGWYLAQINAVSS